MSSLCAGNMLFFGCRSASADFFFHCEWSGMVEAGLLTLHTAFSRDQTQKVLLTVPEYEVYRLSLCVCVCVCVCVCEQVYVQHCIEREGEEVWQWLHHKKAHVFIAGSVHHLCVCVLVPVRVCVSYSNAKRMPVEVQEALCAVCVHWGGLSLQQAQTYLSRLLTSRRLQLETWT